MTQRFHSYFIMSLLQSTGWPRKTFLFGSVGVPGALLRGVWTTMVQASVGLGVGCSFRACQLLTQLFRNADWTAKSGDAFLSDLDPIQTILRHPDLLPWEALVIAELQHLPPDFIKWRDLVKRNALDASTIHSAFGLIYGLLHSDQASAALDAERALYQSRAPRLINTGLEIPLQPSWPDNGSYFQWLEQTVRAYEDSVQALPNPAPALLDAAAVRKRLA
jgi:hypothetical protein